MKISYLQSMLNLLIKTTASEQFEKPCNYVLSHKFNEFVILFYKIRGTELMAFNKDRQLLSLQLTFTSYSWFKR